VTTAVREDLTPTPTRRVEDSDYASFVQRIIRAHGRRVAAGNVEALRDLVDLAAEVDAATRHAVHGLRGHGYSWAEIGARLGVTKQTAHERWGAAQ